MIIKYALVSEVNNSGFKVTFLGETIQSEMNYFSLDTYQPAQGDIVAFIVDNKNKYLCLGKVK